MPCVRLQRSTIFHVAVINTCKGSSGCHGSYMQMYIAAAQVHGISVANNDVKLKLCMVHVTHDSAMCNIQLVNYCTFKFIQIEINAQSYYLVASPM